MSTCACKKKAELPVIDIAHIPFSRYGAYIGISDEKNKLMVYNSRLRCNDSPMLEITFLENGEAVPFTSKATPERCDITAENGSAFLYIKNDNTFVLKTKGLDVRINQVSPGHCYGNEYGENEFRTISVSQNTYALFHLYSGKGELTRAVPNRLPRKILTVTRTDDQVFLAVCYDKTEPRSLPASIDCEKDMAEVRKEWLDFFARVSEAYDVTDFYAQVTWYNIWSSFARARDVYHYDTMLMSKKFMSSVWSWDHCFNALAVAKMNPQTALEQFLAPFVVQDANGALPDMWNPDADTVFGVTKPPIHGWCFSRLMENYDYSADVLRKVYTYLEKWTNWWFDFRDSNHNGIPDYPQGCDSGWDNSSLFDLSYFMETPDLSSFLFLQMKCLAKISDKLSDSEKAAYWNDRAEKLLALLYENNWKNDRFVARVSTTHEYDPNPTSALALMPVILGEYLDHDKMDKLVEILKRDFLTENGIATEAPTSPKYKNDGYWLGPIWAPTTYLMVDGLRRGGYEDLARQIAVAFCNMDRNLAHGNYENFDAITGVGLRAPGYTWTASVYSMLWNEYKPGFAD